MILAVVSTYISDIFHIHQGSFLRKCGKNLISYIESFSQKVHNIQEAKMNDLPPRAMFNLGAHGFNL